MTHYNLLEWVTFNYVFSVIILFIFGGLHLRSMLPVRYKIFCDFICPLVGLLKMQMVLTRSKLEPYLNVISSPPYKEKDLFLLPYCLSRFHLVEKVDKSRKYRWFGRSCFTCACISKQMYKSNIADFTTDVKSDVRHCFFIEETKNFIIMATLV